MSDKKLWDQYVAMEKERDALRAKIEQMERQEPVAWWGRGPRDGRIEFSAHKPAPSVMRDFAVTPLYALPGAQPAPSIKDAIIDDLQSQFDSEGITEHDSGGALIRLSAAIAAVEDNFVQIAPSVLDTYAAGINAVAAMLQSKADEYAKEHGHDDMGGLSFGPGMGGEIKMDYYTNLVELVDDVRAMLADAPEAKP